MQNNHNLDKDISELYAKFMLEEMFPNEYSKLLKSDKPDLVTNDRSIGVEVTRILWENDMAAAVYFLKNLRSQSIDNIEPHLIDNFSQRGYEVLLGNTINAKLENKIIGFSSPSEGTNYPSFERKLETKYKRVNSDIYLKCEYYDLYVIWRELFDDELSCVTKIISEINKRFKIGYRYIYIDIGNYLYRYNTRNDFIEEFESYDLAKRFHEA